MNEAEHPWFRPLWRRVALVAFCAAWSVFEFVTQAPFWGVIAGAFAAYGAWIFLITYKPKPDAEPK
jgi:hypothetical protein